MKAITIWQPWAEFVAAGVKHNETRSWATKYRNKKQAEVPADQEQEKAEAAAGELVPGRDFDPETGEVFENGRPPVDQPTTAEQPKSNQHKVITMGQKAVNA